MNSCARRYEADYLQKDSNPGKAKYIAGMQALFSTYGDSQVLFADYVMKVNSKNKAQKRAIVVTEKHIYKQVVSAERHLTLSKDPKNYKVKKFETPLTEVIGISMSPKADTFVVIKAKEPYRDLLLDLGLSGEDRYSEFVSVIAFQIKKLTDTQVSVEFTDQ